MLDEKAREVVALKRFSLISPVLNGQVKNQKEYFDSLSDKPIEMPCLGVEDYLTPSGKKIIEESGFAGQKELKIIKLVESISNQKIKLRDVIDVDEYLEAIIEAFED